MSSLAVSIITPGELTGADIGAWREIVAADRLLAGPYFSPDFAQAIGRVRRDVQIALWRDGREVRAILPFHRRCCDVGMPIAGPLSDYQALIAEPGIGLAGERIIRDCRLSAFDYRYWLADRLPAGAHHRDSGNSPYLDLGNGFAAYVEQRRAAGVSELQKTFKKRRKLEREVGPLRLVAESDDDRLLAAMMRWKGEQFERTNHVRTFDIGWIVAVINAVRQQQNAHFRGTLSGLYAGDELVAVHFGMRTQRVWHYWFPTHNADFAQYSPGMILALAIAEHAAGIGIERIDLGKGDTRFKTSLGSSALQVEGGYFAGRSLPSMLRHTRFAFEQQFERLPIGPAASWPRRLFNRIEHHLERSYR